MGGFDHSSFIKFKKGIRDRKIRESSIPDEDILAAMRQIIFLPFLGGRKGSLKLLNEHKALLGETLYSEIKQRLKVLCENSYFERKKALLEKNMEDRTHSDEFEKVKVSEPHEVWSIDYTCFDMLGVRFSICVVYELYSQAYLAITPGISENTELAKQAINEACIYSGTRPKNYLLSDNGVQFCSDDFNKVLELANIDDRKTPPGQPWYNGALESGNRDLKRALYTIAFYHVCKEKALTRSGAPSENVFALLQSCCLRTFKLINNRLPRVKFGVTPSDVIGNNFDEIKKKRQNFIQKKEQERKVRRIKQKATPVPTRKTIEQRVTSMWNKVAKTLDNDTLFAVRELLHGRYNAIKN